MKGAFIFLLVTTFLLTNCSENDVQADTDSIVYFEQHLIAEMNYANLKSTFGEPDNDIGSGIHIYVYNLNDNTRIHIGFVDQVIYARHMDSSNNLIKELI